MHDGDVPLLIVVHRINMHVLLSVICLPHSHSLSVCRYTYANGDEYSGEYVEGRKHGQGKFVWAASCAIYLGKQGTSCFSDV